MHQQDKKLMRELAGYWTGVQFDVASYVAAVIPDYHDAHDVVQQVAVVVINKFDQFNPERSFRDWALAIARYEILKYRQRQAREKLIFSQAIVDRVTEAYHALGPEEGGDQVCQALRLCLKSIKGKSRRALRMWYAEQAEAEQIAQVMGVTKNALYVMLHRLRNALRTCVENRMAGMEDTL